jgi:hypothetical protein
MKLIFYIFVSFHAPKHVWFVLKAITVSRDIVKVSLIRGNPQLITAAHLVHTRPIPWTWTISSLIHATIEERTNYIKWPEVDGKTSAHAEWPEERSLDRLSSQQHCSSDAKRQSEVRFGQVFKFKRRFTLYIVHCKLKRVCSKYDIC